MPTYWRYLNCVQETYHLYSKQHYLEKILAMISLRCNIFLIGINYFLNDVGDFKSFYCVYSYVAFCNILSGFQNMISTKNYTNVTICNTVYLEKRLKSISPTISMA